MTDEPTPPPIEDGSPEWSEPPVIEPTTVDGAYPWTEVPAPPRPRNPIGWIVSGMFILLFVVSAVAEYVDQPEGEVSQTALQTSLKYSVSLDPGIAPVARGTIEKSRTDGLKEVLKEATEKAPESEEAARIVVVAARELKEDPPKAALDKLISGEEEVSRAMAPIYGGDPTEPEVDALFEMESNEFAVKLAKAQAQEGIGRESDRSKIVDKLLILKLMVASMGGLGMLVAGAICLIAFFAMTSSGKIVPVGLANFEKSDGDRYMGRFAMYLFAFLAVGYGAHKLSDLPAFDGVGDIWFSLSILVVTLLVVAVLLRLPMMDRSDSLSSVVGEKQPFWKLVRAGAFGYLCTVPILLVAILMIAGLSRFLPDPTHPITEDIAVATSLDWLAIALMAAVLAPLIEELSFRGLLFPALTTQIRKPWVAMLLCGLVFASIHPQGPLAWPALATTGATAAALRYYTGSLVPSIVLHMIHNALILAVTSVIG